MSCFVQIFSRKIKVYVLWELVYGEAKYSLRVFIIQFVVLKLQVKHFLLSVNFFFFIISPVLAENLEFDSKEPENRHSLSLEIASTDDEIDVPTRGETRVIPLDVLKHSLFYSYQLTDHWSMSISAMTGNDQAKGDGSSFELPNLASVSLNKDVSGISSALSYQYDIWSWDLGVSFDEAKTVFSGSSTKTKLSLLERTHSTEVYVASSVEIDWQGGILTPILSLAVQKSEIEREFELSLNDVNAREEVNDKDSGAYLSAGVNGAYLLTSDDGGFFSRILWVPSLSVSWSEIAWGEVVSNSRFQLKNNRFLDSTTSAEKENSEGGSGSYATSLFIILDNYFADLSYSKNFGRGAKGEEFSVMVGLDF